MFLLLLGVTGETWSRIDRRSVLRTCLLAQHEDINVFSEVLQSTLAVALEPNACCLQSHQPMVQLGNRSCLRFVMNAPVAHVASSNVLQPVDAPLEHLKCKLDSTLLKVELLLLLV